MGESDVVYSLLFFLLLKKENNIDEKVWWTILQGGALKTFEDICTSMACNTGEGASLFVFGLAYRGTSCGDKKVILGSLTFYFHPFSTSLNCFTSQTMMIKLCLWTNELLTCNLVVHLSFSGVKRVSVYMTQRLQPKKVRP